MVSINLEITSNEFEKAKIVTDSKFNVLEWNKKAEEIFGYKKETVIGRPSPIIPELSIQERIQLKKRLINLGSVNIQLKVRDKNNDIKNFFSTILATYDEQGAVTSYRFAFEEIHNSLENNNIFRENIEKRKELKDSVNRKRTFSNIRNLILLCLYKSQYTINQIANNTDINWKTVENHLTYLLGRGLVKEVVKSEYVRIFEISEEGKMTVENIKNNISKKEKMSKAEEEIAELLGSVGESR